MILLMIFSVNIITTFHLVPIYAQNKKCSYIRVFVNTARNKILRSKYSIIFLICLEYTSLPEVLLNKEALVIFTCLLQTNNILSCPHIMRSKSRFTSPLEVSLDGPQVTLDMHHIKYVCSSWYDRTKNKVQEFQVFLMILWLLQVQFWLTGLLEVPKGRGECLYSIQKIFR